MTAGLVLVAFAAGLVIAVLLSRRDARARDTKRVAELSAELTVLADPAGVGAPEILRGPLCCRHGKCAPVLARRQQVSAPAAEVVAAYRRALERAGWQLEPAAEEGTTYFVKDIGGRRALASVRVGGQSPAAVVGVSLDAESC